MMDLLSVALLSSFYCSHIFEMLSSKQS